MPRVKLTVEKNVENFKTSASINDVEILELQKYGNINIAICNYKHPSQLYKLGLFQSEVGDPKVYAAKEPEQKQAEKK